MLTRGAPLTPFLPCVISTSGRILGEFLRLLYILAHRCTLWYFDNLGNAEPGTDVLTWRWSQYHWQHKNVFCSRRSGLCQPRVLTWASYTDPNWSSKQAVRLTGIESGLISFQLISIPVLHRERILSVFRSDSGRDFPHDIRSSHASSIYVKKCLIEMSRMHHVSQNLYPCQDVRSAIT